MSVVCCVHSCADQALLNSLHSYVAGPRRREHRAFRSLSRRANEGSRTKALQQLPDQEATVVISNGAGAGQGVFFVVTGTVQRGIRRLDGNPDFAGPGSEPAVEIV